MSVCFSRSLPKREYSSLLTVAAFSYSPFSVKVPLAVKNLYLLTFPDYNVEILVACLSKSY